MISRSKLVLMFLALGLLGGCLYNGFLKGSSEYQINLPGDVEEKIEPIDNRL
jgi:hypothetical protein